MASLSRLSLFLLLGSSLASGALISTPGVSISINGINESALFGFPAIQSGRNAFQISTPVTVPGLVTVTNLGFSSFDDPIVTFNSSGQNLTNAPLQILFSLFNPYIGGPYTTLTDSFQLGVSDGNQNGSVTVTPVTSAISQPQVDGVNRDGQGTSGCALTGTPGFSLPCSNNPSTTISIPPTNAAGTFGVTVNFSISAGDIYTFSGTSTLSGSSIPEPSTYVLLSSGFGLLLLVAAQRRRAERAPTA